MIIGGLLFFSLKGNTQDIHDLLVTIRDHDFQKAEQSIKQSDLSVDLQKELFFYTRLVSTYGVHKDRVDLVFENREYKDPLLIAIHKLNKGLYQFLYEYGLDSEAFNNLKKSLSIAKELNQKALVCEIGKVVFYYFDQLLKPRNSRYEFELYFQDYFAYAYDEKEMSIAKTLEARISMFKDRDTTKHVRDYIITEGQLNILKEESTRLQHDYYRAQALMSLSIYQENKLNDHTSAMEGYKKAYAILSHRKEGIFVERALAASINIAISLIKKEKYKEGIQLLRQQIEVYPTKSISRLLTYKYGWLDYSYKKLGMMDSAYYYDQKNDEIKDMLEQENNDALITKTEIEEGSKEKEKTIKSQYATIYSLIPISGGLLILVVIIYLYYKRYRKRTNSLEKEKSETIEKIDQLKQLVVKNHIVLKDKTKVYVSSLTYIKSDDHFIRLYLQEGKSHFVRGKLSQIKTELPPNFIQCHRSYIVNTNFIKQINANHIILIDKTEIPVSRTYKNNLE